MSKIEDIYQDVKKLPKSQITINNEVVEMVALSEIVKVFQKHVYGADK